MPQTGVYILFSANCDVGRYGSEIIQLLPQLFFQTSANLFYDIHKQTNKGIFLRLGFIFGTKWETLCNFNISCSLACQKNLPSTETRWGKNICSIYVATFLGLFHSKGFWLIDHNWTKEWLDLCSKVIQLGLPLIASYLAQDWFIHYR